MENKMMAMRRALRDVSRVAEEMTRGTITGESVDRKTVDTWAKRLCEIISRDLAIPLRNCDVGTADEQDARFSKFCVEKRSGSCSGCPDAVGGFTVANGIRECALVWAQTPYEAEEGAGK